MRAIKQSKTLKRTTATPNDIVPFHATWFKHQVQGACWFLAFSAPGDVFARHLPLVRRAPQTCHVRGHHGRLRALLFAGLRDFHRRQVDLAVVFAAEVGQVGLGAVGDALAHVAHLERAPPQRPLVPLVVHVQVLLYEVRWGLGARVPRAREQASVAALRIEGTQATHGRRTAGTAVAVRNELRNRGVGELVLRRTHAKRGKKWQSTCGESFWTIRTKMHDNFCFEFQHVIIPWKNDALRTTTQQQ